MPEVSYDEEQPELPLQGFTYRERAVLMPALDDAIDRAGGWVLRRRTLSANAMETSLEVQARALPEVYAAMLATGVELTRDSHRALAQRCNCSLHLPPPRGASSILSMRLEIHFLAEALRPLELSRLLLLGTARA